MQFTPTRSDTTICADSGYMMSIIDRDFLYHYTPDIKILHTTNPIHITGISNNKLRSSKYIVLKMIFLGIYSDREKAMASVTSEVHIIPSLKANLLRSNILA